MKSKINLIFAVSVLILVSLACSGSFTTANIGSFNFGKNEDANPPTTTFNVGEKIFAVANVANTSGKHKLKFKISFENVQGKGKGEEALTKDIDFEGSRAVFLNFNAPLPGEYKLDAALLDESGKEIDKKSGTVTVKGDAPAPTTNSDSEDK